MYGVREGWWRGKSSSRRGGSRESTVPPVANLVTRARISADLYRRQLRPVPARPGKRVGWEPLARPLYVRAVHTYFATACGPGMIVELYKDEKLMLGHGAETRARARKEPPLARRHIGFCPNPQSLRALMTARHDPPGKILGDLERATLNMQRGSNLWLCRGAARSGGSRLRRTRRLFMARGLSNGTIQWISLVFLSTEYHYSNKKPL